MLIFEPILTRNISNACLLRKCIPLGVKTIHNFRWSKSPKLPTIAPNRHFAAKSAKS